MAKIFLADPENCDVKIGNLLEKFVSKVLSYPPGTCPLTVQYSLLCASMNQTCGKCVPCRDGLPQLSQMLKKILDGDATMDTLEEMGLDVERLCPVRKDWNDDLCAKFEKKEKDA